MQLFFIQNIPQIVVQITFGIMVHNITNIIIISVILSFILSIPFLMIWTLSSMNDRVSSWKEYDIDVVLIAPSHGQGTKGGISAIVTMDIKHERSQLRRYSCKKRLLQKTLSEILGVCGTKFEIGYIEMMTEGCKIHIIHQVTSVGGDRDISKLYEGKYEILSKALKNMYHVSLEWGLLCTLSDEMHKSKDLQKEKEKDIPMGHMKIESGMVYNKNKINSSSNGKVNSKKKNGNGKFVHVGQETPTSDNESDNKLNFAVPVIPNKPNDDRDEAINGYKVPESKDIVTKGGHQKDLHLGQLDVDYDEEYVNNMLDEKRKQMELERIRREKASIGSEGPKNINNTEHRESRLDSEVSDLFGVGGNDSDPFGVPIIEDGNATPIGDDEESEEEIEIFMEPNENRNIRISTAGMQFDESDESSE